MQAYCELLEPTKSEKHGSFTFTPASTDFGPEAGTLVITGRRSHAVYAVSEFPADHGRGFTLRKTAGGSDKSEGQYSCLIAGERSQCECKGFYATGKCKHIASITELLKANRI